MFNLDAARDAINDTLEEANEDLAYSAVEKLAEAMVALASMKRIDVKPELDIAGYVMQLHDGCWLTTRVGDPPRTLVMKNAKIFKTEKKALKALKVLRKRFQYRTYENAKAVAVYL